MTDDGGLDWAAVDPAVCSIGAAVARVGDRWSLLVLREVSLGVTRFGEIQAHTSVSRRTLAERLATLVADGLLERVPYGGDGERTRHEYRLTAAGADLLPVLIALREWGDRHGRGRAAPAVVTVHRGCGAPVALELRCAAGHEVPLGELEARRGPGARRLRRRPARRPDR